MAEVAHILIVYGTTYGQTGKIASFISDQITKTHNGQVTLVDSQKGKPPEDLSAFDGVLVLSSIHSRGYQKPIQEFLEKQSGILSGMTSCFISVCLSIRSENEAERVEAQKIAEQFVTKYGWKTGFIRCVAGSLSYTRYDPIVREKMKRIAEKEGAETDTSEDYEYTDWKEVEALTADFMDMVRSDSKTTP